VRIGAYYPPVSLEDTASGWSSPYTLSNSLSTPGSARRFAPSALKANWNGSARGSATTLNLGMTGAVFGWNEPAGTVVGTGGFSLNDFQTSLPQGYVGGHSSAVFPEQSIFHEIDGHEGFMSCRRALLGSRDSACPALRRSRQPHGRGSCRQRGLGHALQLGGRACGHRRRLDGNHPVARRNDRRRLQR